MEWLKQYVDFDDTVEGLDEKLTATGTAVENVSAPLAGIENVVVAEILKIEQHPNADKLTVCQVTTGDETYSIVCGAKNMKEGDHVPLALVGAELPGGFKIKKSKLRGVESQG